MKKTGKDWQAGGNRGRIGLENVCKGEGSVRLNTGMRCHDLCPKMEMEKLFTQVKEHDIRQIQLAFRKFISDYDFTAGHYSSSFIRTIAQELEKNQIHVAVLGCYINPVNPIESIRQTEVARFIEYMKYTRIIGADMVGTETGRLDPDLRVTEESHTGDAYQLLLGSMRETVAAAEKLGVIVGVEGVFNHTLYSPTRMKRFLEDIDSPNVEVMLDVVNLIHPEQAEPEAWKEVVDRAFAYYDDRIDALHVKDFISDDQEQLFRHVGGGLFQHEPLMRHVKERKPHIAMLSENSSRERYHEGVKFLQTIYDQVQIWNTPKSIKRLWGVL